MVVGDLILIKLLLLFERILIFCKESLGLVVDEIAEYFKAIPLFDRLLFEKLGYYRDS